MTDKEKFIILASGMPINKSDAIVILEGDGDNRIEHACDLYKQEYASNLVFSGNIINLEYGSYPFNYVKNTFIKNNVDPNDVIIENKSTNTKEQAEQIIKLCLENNWRSIILIISNYHQFRAYLTFIKELYNQKLNNSIRIYNSSCNLSWFKKNNWGIRYELLESEFNKIEIYQTKGDVCTYDKAIEYLKWIDQY